MNSGLLLIGTGIALGVGVFLLRSQEGESAATAARIWQQGTPIIEPEPDFSLIDWGESVTGLTDTPADKMPHLVFFEPSEFREWWLYMDTDLLQKLDTFRSLWGRPVAISSHPDALGRHMGAGGSKSYHNIDRYGAVRAVDIFPQGLNPGNAAQAVQLAEQAGFGGIGLYTDTQPSMMMHLDNRATPGRWARVAGNYLGIEQAYA